MLLIEADGKTLLAERGIPVPAGIVVTDGAARVPGDGPWMVKAQVPVGGRGKAGGIVRCSSAGAVFDAIQRMLGSRLKGHRIDACMVEEAASGQERYLAVMVDAASYGLRVIYAAQGGMEIEQ
ncbi:MAG TPA: ATP-grasp domain-containing protein, partial [Rhodopila sp.]|nr:ATP-grasp domain-containing protein [Rhodopila sp.]